MGAIVHVPGGNRLSFLQMGVWPWARTTLDTALAGFSAATAFWPTLDFALNRRLGHGIDWINAGHLHGWAGVGGPVYLAVYLVIY